MKAFLTVLLLVTSNIFMTFAWYGHLKLQEMKISTGWPVFLVILFSWGLAFFEYCAQVPANRIGFSGNGGPFNIMQLKVIQEAVSLTVFTIIVTFLFKGQPLQWNHLVEPPGSVRLPDIGCIFRLLEVNFKKNQKKYLDCKEI